MKNLKILLVACAALMLSACSSSNVKGYRADYATFAYLKNDHTPTMNVEKVTMPKGDKNSIMCRMSGNVYLPNKMTYSEYLREALHKVLITADKFDDSGNAKRTISIELEDVTFNSLGGSWTIHGKLVIDNKPAIDIKTSTNFGTAFDAGSACHNAAGAFEEAVTDFIKEVLHRVK